MRKYDLALFDVDGTILDTSEGILRSTRYAIEAMGLPMPTEAELLRFIGPPAQTVFREFFGLSAEDAKEAANLFRGRYTTEDLLLAKPYPGIYDVFEKLRENGAATAIATYKRRDYAGRVVLAFGFGEYTDNIHGSDFEMKLTKKDIIETCILESGVTDRGRIVMIGDTLHDQKGALEAGVDFIGVTFGFGFSEEADMAALPYIGCAETAEDILKFILTDGEE